MKWFRGKTTLLAAVGLALLISGCSSSSTVNVITVSVAPSAVPVLAGQVQTFTAVVNGSTNTTVTNWDCSYSYTPSPTTANPNPKAVPGTCTSGGTMHGGALMALADTTMVIALCATNGDFLPVTTVDMNTTFMRPAANAGVLAEATILRQGRTLAFCQTRLLLDTPERPLIASAAGTYAILQK